MTQYYRYVEYGMSEIDFRMTLPHSRMTIVSFSNDVCDADFVDPASVEFRPYVS